MGRTAADGVHRRKGDPLGLISRVARMTRSLRCIAARRLSTNAFVTSAPAEELVLVDGADLDSDVADAVVASLVAVIVAAYDAETYIIWEPR